MKTFYRDYKRMRASPGYVSLLWWMLDQSFWVILFYRTFSLLNENAFSRYPARFLEKLVEMFTKVYLSSNAKIGEGLIIHHAHGLIINGNSVLGKNCTIYSRVCVGSRWPGDEAPTIGDDVTIGTGACVFGPVNIPSGTTIPANSVITPKAQQLHQNGQ